MIGVAVLVAVFAAVWLIQNPEPIFIGKAPNGVAVCAWTYVDGTTAWLSESDLQQSPWKNRKHISVTAKDLVQAASWLETAESYKKAWIKISYDYDYDDYSSYYDYSYADTDVIPNKK